MKVIISPMFEVSDANYLRRCYRLPLKELSSLGWSFIDPKDIIGYDFKDFFFNKYNILPEILLFWSYNYKVFLMWDFIYKHRKDIYGESWLKCVYLDDIHTKLNSDLNAQRLSVFMNFDCILTPYATLFNKFYPSICVKKVFLVPHFVNNDFYVDFNNNPANKILLSGVINKYYYPFRFLLYNVAISKKYPIDILKFSDSPSNDFDLYYGKSYIMKLNGYLVGFATSGNIKLPYVVAKFFEIPAAGALMLAHDELIKSQLLNLGFRSNVHYISITINNLDKIIKFVLNPKNRSTIDRIRRQGYDFVWNNHTSNNRANTINKICQK